MKMISEIAEKKNSGPPSLRRALSGWVLLFGLGLVLVPFLPSTLSAQKPSKDSDNAVTKLRIEVTAGKDGDPVDNASVYIKWNEDRKLRKDKKVEQNWKTNKDGIVKVPEVPRGSILIQVIAPGWKTFGRWYDLDQSEQTIKIRLEKPPQWY